MCDKQLSVTVGVVPKREVNMSPPAALQDDFLSSFDQKYLPTAVPATSSLWFETVAENDSHQEVLPKAHDPRLPSQNPHFSRGGRPSGLEFWPLTCQGSSFLSARRNTWGG